MDNPTEKKKLPNNRIYLFTFYVFQICKSLRTTRAGEQFNRLSRLREEEMGEIVSVLGGWTTKGLLSATIYLQWYMVFWKSRKRCDQPVGKRVEEDEAEDGLDLKQKERWGCHIIQNTHYSLDESIRLSSQAQPFNNYYFPMKQSQIILHHTYVREA